MEGREVDLPQRPLRHLGADGHALELGVIADEVLDRGGHPSALSALDVGDRHAGREEGILRVALEVAPRQR